MSALTNLLGENLLSKDGTIDTLSLKFEADEVFGLYFSAHWCPPCRGFTPKLVSFHNAVNKSAPKLKIVFVSSDRDGASFDEYYGEMPWYALPFENSDKKKSLSKLCKVAGIPTLVLFNQKGEKLAVDGDPRERVASDPEGKEFPWPQKPISELLTGKLIDKDKKESSFEEIMNAGNKIGIYFSAHWCPPCRGFTPKLVEIYEKVKAKGHKFEIVFASSDRDEKAFQEYLETMPWKAIPLGDQRKEKLSRRFGVEGIPTLVILDSDGKIINTDGRSSVNADKEGNEFPWHPKPVNSLSESAAVLNEYATLILFSDGSDEEVKEVGKSLLLPVAEKLGDAAIPGNDSTELLFVCAGGDNDDDLCESVRRFAKLPKSSENPSLLIVLDIPDGQVYVHDGKVESSDQVQQIVDNFKAGKLSFRGLKD